MRRFRLLSRAVWMPGSSPGMTGCKNTKMPPPSQKPALRPFLPADTPVLAAIFQASVEELTREDYSEAQQAAWAGQADDEAAFGARLAGALTLVATIAGA